MHSVSTGFSLRSTITVITARYWGNAEYSTPNLLNSYNHIMFGEASLKISCTISLN